MTYLLARRISALPFVSLSEPAVASLVLPPVPCMVCRMLLPGTAMCMGAAAGTAGMADVWGSPLIARGIVAATDKPSVTGMPSSGSDLACPASASRPQA